MKLPNKLKSGLLDYCNDNPNVNFSYIKDLLVDELESQNIPHTSQRLSEISNDLINIRKSVLNRQLEKANAQFNRLEDKLTSL